MRGEIIYQIVFDESGESCGYILHLNMFGISGFAFGFEKSTVPTKWKTDFEEVIFPDFTLHVIDLQKENNALLEKWQEDFLRDRKWFKFYIETELEKNNFYVYNHSPLKSGGYVRILTKEDPGETVKPRIERQEHYPHSMENASDMEKFLFDNLDEDTQYFSIPEDMRVDFDYLKWKFGMNLQLDPDICYVYFNDEVRWNDIYWDLFSSIGYAWKGNSFVCAWRNDEEQKLVAETNAHRLLFWCMENGYTLNDLMEMIETKRIIEKRFV